MFVGPLAPLLVFFLAAAESAAFFGMVVPGELAVILGGVAAGAGATPLWLAITAAVAGALVGDSIGYRLGHRMGPRLLQRRGGGRVQTHLDSAAKLVARRGWWALVVARFAAVLRALVPFAAGMGSMPYRRFLLGNAIGGILWGTTFTMVGYVAGSNYATVERWIRTGGLAVVVLLATLALIVWTTRWVQSNRDRVTARAVRVLGSGPVGWLVRIVTRTDRPAVVLAGAGATIVAGLWVFGGLVQDVLRSEEFFFFDISSLRYLETSSSSLLVALARPLIQATRWPWMLVVAVMAGVWWWRRRPRASVALAASLVGQWITVEATAALVDRTPPSFEPLLPRLDYGFPSEHVALVAALTWVLVWPWNRPGWAVSVARMGVGLIVVTLVGAARIVLLLDFPSDVIAAIAISTAWTLLVSLIVDARDRRSPVDDAAAID